MQPTSLKARIPLVGFLFFISITGSSQERFKEAFQEAVTCQQILPSDSGYVGVSQMYNPAIGQSFVRLLKFDAFGKLIDQKDLIDSSLSLLPSNFISLDTTNYGNYIFTSGYIDLSANFVMVFDIELDTLWTRRFSDTSSRIFNQLKAIPDDGFTVSATIFHNNQREAHLLKLDSIGHTEWQRFYRDPTLSLLPLHVYPSKMGYLMTGIKQSLTNPKKNDPWLMMTDTLGNKLWEKTYGGPGLDILASAQLATNGNWMVFYTEAVDTIFISQNPITRFRPIFSLIDGKNGIVLQENKMGSLVTDMFSYTLVKQQEKYVGAGTLRNAEDKYEGGSELGYTFAVDKNLDSLWFRTYSQQGLDAESDDDSRLFGVAPTPDGGFIGGGIFQTGDPSVTGRIGPNGWIIKLDSNGCADTACANSIGLSEQAGISQTKIEVFPNPTADAFQVQLSERWDGHIFLYDLKGVKLREAKIRQGQGMLNTDGLAAGMYLLNVKTENGFTATRKVFVQD